MQIIETGSPEHMANFTDEQLRTLAASTDPAHIVHGFAAECELSLREAAEEARWANWRKDEAAWRTYDGR